MRFKFLYIGNGNKVFILGVSWCEPNSPRHSEVATESVPRPPNAKFTKHARRRAERILLTPLINEPAAAAVSQSASTSEALPDKDVPSRWRNIHRRTSSCDRSNGEFKFFSSFPRTPLRRTRYLDGEEQEVYLIVHRGAALTASGHEDRVSRADLRSDR